MTYEYKIALPHPLDPAGIEYKQQAVHAYVSSSSESSDGTDGQIQTYIPGTVCVTSSRVWWGIGLS